MQVSEQATEGSGSRPNGQSAGVSRSGGRRLLVEAVLFAAATALFLALSLTNITLPGLYYDEALDVVPAMQLLQGAPVEPVRGAALTVAGRTFPLMIMDYVGTVNTYLAVPIFALFGVSVASVRLLPIILAVVSLALGYRLAQRLFDWRVAALATLLVAVDPSYVFFSRMGIHVTSVMNVCALGSVLLFLRWHDDGRLVWLALAGLVLGFGLWAKVLFLWWIVALVVFGAVHQWRKMGRVGHKAAPGRAAMVAAGATRVGQNARPTRWTVVVAAVTGGVLVGAAPLWAYNLMTGGTFIAFGRNLLVTEHGVSNLNVPANLWAAAESFVVLLDGRYFWFLGSQIANSVNVIVFAVAVLACVLLAQRRPAWRMGLALVGTLIVLVVAQSAFTVSGIWATHLYILFPLPQMVMAAGIILVAEAAAPRRRWLQVGFVGLACLGVMLASLRTDIAYHRELERSRGLSRFSDAIYDLAVWLDQRAPLTVYAVDWGIQKNVQILTQGRVNPIEISGYAGEPEGDFVRRAEEALRTPGAVYVMHSKEDTVYELFPLFQATAERLGVRLKIIDATHDNSGAPVHVMWARE